MTRDEAYKLMTDMIQNQNLRKHGVAVEAIMRSLCKELKKRVLNSQALQDDKIEEEFDEEEWAIVGLLHDADYELIEKDPKRNTLRSEERRVGKECRSRL